MGIGIYIDLVGDKRCGIWRNGSGVKFLQFLVDVGVNFQEMFVNLEIFCFNVKFDPKFYIFFYVFTCFY
jgi:hypothetical protein